MTGTAFDHGVLQPETTGRCAGRLCSWAGLFATSLGLLGAGWPLARAGSR